MLLVQSPTCCNTNRPLGLHGLNRTAHHIPSICAEEPTRRRDLQFLSFTANFVSAGLTLHQRMYCKVAEDQSHYWIQLEVHFFLVGDYGIKTLNKFWFQRGRDDS